MTRPTIDVVVTNWNQHDYVRAAVDSALDQDDVFTRVILVDDASDVPMPVGDWPQDRVHVVWRRSPGGQGATINTGLSRCVADVVTFLDGDDLFPSYRCGLLFGQLATQAADVAFGGQVVFNDGAEPLLRLSASQRRTLPQVQPAALVGTTMVRRSLFDRFGPLPEGRMVAAFIEWLAVARAGDDPPAEVSVTAPVLLRRSHETNATRRLTAHTGEYLQAVSRRRSAGRP